MLRVTLINDDELVRRGLVSMLRRYHQDIALVDLSGRCGTEADIALFDTSATGRDSGASVESLVADPRIRTVVVYTWNFQPWLAREVLEQGAAGYLSKSLTSAQLVAALHRVHAGNTVVSPATRTNQAVGSEWPGREEGLTAREAEVLSLITMGLSNVDVAKRMSVSVNSVKSYIRSCYRKIDVDSRSQAVLWGVAHGLRAGRLTGSTAAGPALPDASHAEDHRDLVAT
jgi:two-component system, NarL family, response regulator LiaR